MHRKYISLSGEEWWASISFNPPRHLTVLTSVRTWLARLYVFIRRVGLCTTRVSFTVSLPLSPLLLLFGCRRTVRFWAMAAKWFDLRFCKYLSSKATDIAKHQRPWSLRRKIQKKTWADFPVSFLNCKPLEAVVRRGRDKSYQCFKFAVINHNTNKETE